MKLSFYLAAAAAAAAAAKSLQSCPTLCDPIDGSPPGSPIPGILQAKKVKIIILSLQEGNAYYPLKLLFAGTSDLL